jgi:hypothetical protein
MSIEGFQEDMGEILSDEMGECRIVLASCDRPVDLRNTFVEDAHILALLASEAYKTHPSAVGEYIVQESGFLTSDGRRVLVLRGTDSYRDQRYDLTHIAPVVPLLFGLLGGGTYFLVDYFETIRRVFEKFRSLTNISAVVGHSLGGYFASILCSHSGLPGMAFQAPGTPPKMRGTNIHPNFKVINVANDLIGNWSNNYGRGHGPYPVHYFPMEAGGSVRDRHSIEKLAEYLRNRGDTNANVVTVGQYA